MESEFGFVCCLLMINFRLAFFGRNASEAIQLNNITCWGYILYVEIPRELTETFLSIKNYLENPLKEKKDLFQIVFYTQE